MRAIALQLDRSASTVSREIKRNGGYACYRAGVAEESAWRRALRPKVVQACRTALPGAGGGPEATTPVVTGANSGLVEAAIPTQRALPRVTRNDLQEFVYSGSRCTEEGTACRV